MPGDVAIWRTGGACSRRMARMKEELTWMRMTVFDGSFQLRFFYRSCIFGLALTFGKVACSRHKYLTMEMDTT